MGDFFASVRGVGGIDPIHPDRDRHIQRERQRGRDSSGREWTQQEEGESQLADQFQEKASPIRPTSPERKIRAVVQKEEGLFQWARQQLRLLSLREKIGQLLMLVIDKPVDPSELTALVKRYSVGVVLFTRIEGSLSDHLALIEQLQQALETPLLIGLIWGSGTTLDQLESLPQAATLSRIKDDALLQEIARCSARQMRELGIHLLMFSLTPRTPDLAKQIGERLFLGSEREEVVRKGIVLQRGFKEEGVLGMPQTCLPLETDEESEIADWIVSQLLHRVSHFSYEQIRPFRLMAQGGVDPLVLPYMLLPVLVGNRDDESCYPEVGLAFGHLLERQEGWRSRFLLTSRDLDEVVDLAEAAVESGAVSESEIDHRVLALLKAKETAGIHRQEESASPSSDELHELKRRAYQAAMIVKKNDPSALPLTEHVGLLEIDAEGESRFSQELAHRTTLTQVSTTAYALEDPSHEEAVIQKFQENRIVVVAAYAQESLAAKSLELVHRLRLSNKQVILVAFVPPAELKGIGREAVIVIAHEHEPLAQLVAADFLCGALDQS
jgi:beta-N-acetylhexosaminidase